MKNFTRITLLILLFSATAFSAKAVTASFTADVTAGCAPLVVHFTNTSTGATTYFWDFGTGTTSTLKDPSTSFTTPGTYTVKLTSTTGGVSVTTTMTITVYPSPTVSFTSSTTSVCPGAPVSFTSTTTGGVTGPITYTWGFGDGGVSTSPTPTYSYATPGLYNITLTATNSKGCVTSLTSYGYMTVFKPPVPAFTTPTTFFCKAPAFVPFTDLTTGTPSFIYKWDLGDGTTSTSPAPAHNYTAPGNYDVQLVVTDGNGCVDSITQLAYISIGPIKADFTFPATLCTNSPAAFINTSTSHITSDWSYGDGGTDVTNDGLHSYTATGTYTVRLIIDNGSCKDTIKHTVKVIPGPKIDFAISPKDPCPPPAAIKFTGTAPSGTLVSWSYGDGGFGSGLTTTHTYGWRGVDTIVMTGTDPATGCVTTVTKLDTLYDIIHGAGADHDRGCVPLTVHFVSILLTGEPDTTKPPTLYPFGIASYYWVLGDGTTSTLATPVHTYTAVGIYMTHLTMVTKNGCTVIDSFPILVGTPPVITVTAPTRVCFHDKATYYANIVSGPIDKYEWYPDSGPSEVHGTSTMDSFKASFYLPGTWGITVVPSFRGCYGPAVKLVKSTIVDSPMSRPVRTMLCSPYQRVSFGDSSLGDDSHIWFFGDGSNSTLKNEIHLYPLAIVYTVTLTTYNATSGCRDTAHFAVDLHHPTVDFMASKTGLCRGDLTTFTAVVTGDTALYYHWDNGGYYRDPYLGWRGPVDSGNFLSTIIDSFPNSGLFSPRLIIADHNGCYDTITKTNFITVGGPLIFFSATPTTGCAPLTTTFTDVSTDVPGLTFTKYMWAFGDGSTATVTTPSVSHTFVTAGTFATKEIAIDNNGCKDSTTMSLVTAWKPHANFSVYNTPCVGVSTTFTNSSVGGLSYYWTFGDGATSTVTSPSHTYTAAGIYSVSLGIVDAHGCVDTLKLPSYMTVTEVHADFDLSDTFVICPPKLVSFTDKSIGATIYSWDMGDGTVSVIKNPVDLYIKNGYYTIKLVASNKYGCSSVDSAHLNIYGYDGAFSYSPLTGCAPLGVHFKASISNVPNIIWDFSDGSTSTVTKVDTIDHIYTSPGAYVPKLILGDDLGCQNSSQGIDTIKVDGVIPDFKNAPLEICVNMPMNFKDYSRSYFSTITGWDWTMSDGSTSNVSSPSYTYSVAGTFPVALKATDGWGCSDTLTKLVNVLPLPDIKASPDTIICLSDAATLSVTGGVTYIWNDATTLSTNTGTTVKASPAVVTTYTVTGTDVHGCVNIDSVTVKIITKTVSHATGDAEVCKGTVVPLHDSGGTSYLWIPGTGLNDPYAQSPFAAPNNTQRYTVIAYLGSCVPDTEAVWVTVHQLPTVDAGPNQRLVEGSIAELQATGSLIQTISWGNTDLTLSCDSCLTPTATMSVTTTYTINVASDFGCKASDTVTIQIYCDKSQIFVPNTFTPNGDGQNDILYPRGVGVKMVNSFRIYNRWGQLLFERSNIHLNDAANAWDGSYQGSMPRPDVYVYVLEALCQTGEPISIKGDVTIIK